MRGSRVNRDRLVLEIRRARVPFAFFVLLLVCGGVATAVIFKNLTFKRPFTDYYEVRAAFDDVKGVVPGQHQVRISGVKVGVVSESKLVNGRPVLTLQIQQKLSKGPIYRDARLRIRPVTPLQDMYVNIVDRGTRAAGVADKRHIITAERTVSPVDISRVMDTFDADTRKRLTLLLHGLGRGLNDRGASLRASFAELAPFLNVAERASGALARRRRDLRQLVDSFAGLTDALAKRDAQLATLVRSGGQSLGELAANDQPLAATLAELPPTIREIRGSFDRVRFLSAHLDPALRNMLPVADRLEPGLGALERFGHDARPAFVALRRAVRPLLPLANNLAPTSRSLDSAFRRLRPQAPRFDRMTAQVPPCFDAIARFFQNTISVTKFYDAQGAIPRAESTIDFDSGFGRRPANLRRTPSCIDKLGGPIKTGGPRP